MAILGPVEPGRGFDGATEGVRRGNRQAATNCFWAPGYESTSVRDLAGQMGITGVSLCNAFGDEPSLYGQALEYSFEQSVHDRIGRFDKLARLIQCAPTARLTGGGRIHPGSCR